MSNLGGKPLIYSSGDDNRNQRYFLAGFFAFLFIFFLGFGIFLGLQSADWWVMYFLGPIAILLAALAVGFFPRGEDSFYRMMVYDGHLEQEWKNKGDDQIYHRKLLFKDVEECLIGIASRRLSATDGDLYRYHGVVVLMGAWGVFHQEVLSEAELYEWRRRLFDQVGVLGYAEVDLADLLDSGGDFSSVPRSKDNVVSEFVGLERERPFILVDRK